MENISSESESNDKLQPPKVEEEKKNDIKRDNIGVNINIKSNSEKKCETIAENKVAVKNELDDVKIYDEISLSEGELFEFDSFSSVISEGEIDDLDLSSFDDNGCGCNNDNFNVIIQIENELAFRSSNKDGNVQTQWKNEKSIPVRHSSKQEKCLGDYCNKRCNGFRDYKDHKPWRNTIDNYQYSRRDKRSGEREAFNRKRSPTPRDYDRHRTAYNDRSKTGRRIDAKSRFRRSKSSERSTRYWSSRSIEKNSRPRSPNHKDRKIERKHFNSFDVKARKPNNRSPTMYNKRKRSPLPSSPASVWKRLDSRLSPDRLSSRTRKPYNKPARKKERTPFLIELEKKLKEADFFSYIKADTTETATAQKEVPIIKKATETAVAPEPTPPVSQNPNPPFPPTYVPPVPNVVQPLQYPPIPTLSVDNLPLVPGPNGLPVYITVTGEHILHDMDGRRIPVGPNGYYLPLDPTGRLYAHIVSPGNQAVPIHMTDDGVLRLPNSEPVPFGPGHKLPVNIDGTHILIGPDSKPLYPCLNIPREPPLKLLQLVNTGVNYQHNTPQPVLPQPLPPPMPVASQPPKPENKQTVQAKPQCITIPDKSNGPDIFQPAKKKPTLIDPTKKSSDKKSKTGAVKSDNEKVRKKNEDSSIEQVAKETENNTVVNTKYPVVGQRCTSQKFSPDPCDSENSTCSVRVMPSPKNGIFEEILLSSDDEVNCDKESQSSKAEKRNAECDSKDPVAEKIRQAIESLSLSNYKPPTFGRFILSKVPKQVVEKLPNESPLLRNQVKLPFLTPTSSWPANQPVMEDITFKFLSKKNLPKGETNSSGVSNDKLQEKFSDFSKMSISTVEFSVQCDLTSDEITKLRFNVAKLESEVIRLKSTNTSLLEGYRNAQLMIKRKNEQLKKVSEEVKEKENEILSLKLLFEK